MEKYCFISGASRGVGFEIAKFMASKGLFSWFRKKSAPESNNAEKVELAKDDVLSKFKDFDFAKEKQDIILIKEKMKKVACLNIISAIIKEAETDIKLKLKN